MNTHTNKSLTSCWVNAVVMMAAYNTEIFALKKQIWVQSVRVTAEWSITVFVFTLDAKKKKKHFAKNYSTYFQNIGLLIKSITSYMSTF